MNAAAQVCPDYNHAVEFLVRISMLTPLEDFRPALDQNSRSFQLGSVAFHPILSQEISTMQYCMTGKPPVRFTLMVIDAPKAIATLTDAKNATSRDTISRHVSANDTNCAPRILHWIDNFEDLIMGFSWDLDCLELFFYFIRRHSSV
jgi:hypothetical protein